MPARFLALLLLAGAHAFAQTPDVEIRQLLQDFIAVLRRGDREAVNRYLAPGRMRYSPGGTTLSFTMWTSAASGRFRRTSHLVRHVHRLTDDSAVAVGIWRNAAAKPPFDAGTLDIGVVLVDGVWKISSAHEAYLISPDAAAPGVAAQAVEGDGVLTAEERAAGWQALFDGKSMTGWVTMTGRTELPDCWRMEDGTIGTVAGRQVNTALRTARSYTNFEMSFEWKTAEKANSGVKYRLYAVET